VETIPSIDTITRIADIFLMGFSYDALFADGPFL
jgi:hypothetical protein